MFNLIYFLFNLNITELLNYCFVKEVMAEYFFADYIKLTFGEDHVSPFSLSVIYANEEVKTIAGSLASLWKVASQVCSVKKTAEEKETI